MAMVWPRAATMARARTQSDLLVSCAAYQSAQHVQMRISNAGQKLHIAFVVAWQQVQALHWPGSRTKQHDCAFMFLQVAPVLVA